MDSPTPLHDSGLSDSRLLAGLLNTGTLLLDADDNLRFASASACELLGAPDEALLQRGWPELGAQLHVDRWPRALADGSAFQGCADVMTPIGPRALRYEMHATTEAGCLHRALLVRDRAQLLPRDRVLLLAAEAQRIATC